MKCTNEYVDSQQHHLSESNDTFFRNLKKQQESKMTLEVELINCFKIELSSIS